MLPSRAPSASPKDDEVKTSSRQALLESASSLMSERGSIDVSLSEIARHSGLNSALVKYYFGDKQGMMLALVEDVLSRSLSKLDELVDMEISATDKLKLHVKAIITIYFRYPFINRLIHLLFEDEVAGRHIAERISKPLAETQRKILEQGAASGEFKTIDPMMFYFIILGACDHVFFGQHMMRVAFGIDQIDDDLRRRYTKTLLDIVLAGVLSAPPVANGPQVQLDG